MSYYQKYIKYKTKYLTLAKQMDSQIVNQNGGKMSYDKMGCAYKVINKRSKHYNEIGIIINIDNKMVGLVRIRPRTKEEHKKALKECNKCVGFTSEYPLIYIKQNSIRKLTKDELTPEIKKNIKKTWKVFKTKNLSTTHGMDRHIIDLVNKNKLCLK